MKHRFFSRTGFAIWLAASIGAACVLPYAIALAPQALEQASQKSGLPVNALIAISLLQSVVLLGAMTFTGLWAARKVGLGAPLLEHLFENGNRPDLSRAAALAIGLGIAGGIAIIALDVAVFAPLVNADVDPQAENRPPVWAGLLASLYGGITEEVQMRLFLFSILALGASWIAKRLGRSTEGELGPALFWAVNIVVAIAFGLGHLPATAELVPITPIVVFRAIALNGIVGLIAAYLFWKKGIEMAMLCHFSADIVLHVLFRAATA